MPVTRQLGNETLESAGADAGTTSTDTDSAGDAKPAKPKGRARRKRHPKPQLSMWQQMRLSGEEDTPNQTRKKAPLPRQALRKKRRRQPRRRLRVKKRLPKTAAVDYADEPAPVTDEAVVSDASVDETQRAPIQLGTAGCDRGWRGQA